MKINVKCLYSFIQTQGRKGKLHFAQIMFKHSLAASAILKRHFLGSGPGFRYSLSSLNGCFFALAKTAIITHNTVA